MAVSWSLLFHHVVKNKLQQSLLRWRLFIELRLEVVSTSSTTRSKTKWQFLPQVRWQAGNQLVALCSAGASLVISSSLKYFGLPPPHDLWVVRVRFGLGWIYGVFTINVIVEHQPPLSARKEQEAWSSKLCVDNFSPYFGPGLEIMKQCNL